MRRAAVKVCVCSERQLKRSFSTGKHVRQQAMPPHLLTLADLTVPQIQHLITSAAVFKDHVKSKTRPDGSGQPAIIDVAGNHSQNSLQGKTVALMFSKRSTRTRVASESATKLLGGHPMFLGSQDIQLGVNESLYDTTKVVSSMVDGIMARVGHHSEVETLAQHSSVPIINALSHLYHPTQILADLQTLVEVRNGASAHHTSTSSLESLKGLTVAWVGDSNNILNDMIVAYPRLGINLKIATPKQYALDDQVVERAHKGISDENVRNAGQLVHTNDPLEAVHKADVVVTDTWISMGQEDETAKRLKEFEGYQVTEDMFMKAQANDGALFMHCLPRHEYEVDDKVFYGPRSVVFQEAENRKWTIMACFDAFFGRWHVPSAK